jgi:hypothetical protein
MSTVVCFSAEQRVMITMSDEQRFEPGTRVRATYTVGRIASGTRGTVVYTFLLAPLYQVCFDGDTVPQLVAHYKLTPDPLVPTGAADAS